MMHGQQNVKYSEMFPFYVQRHNMNDVFRFHLMFYIISSNVNNQWFTFTLFFLSFTAKKVCTACSRTSYKIVPLTNLNKCLQNDTSETEVDLNISVNNGSEKF
jgi:hypothetical protein